MAINGTFDIGGQQFTDGGGTTVGGFQSEPLEVVGGLVGGTIGAIGGIVGGVISEAGGISDPFGDGALRGVETGGGTFDLGLGQGPLNLDILTPEERIPSIIQPISLNPNEIVRIPVVRCPNGSIMTDAGCPGVGNGVTPGAPVAGPLNPLEQLQNLLRGIGLRTGGPRPTIGAAGTRLVAAQPQRSPLTTILILAAAGGIGYYLWRRFRKKPAGGGGS